MDDSLPDDTRKRCIMPRRCHPIRELDGRCAPLMPKLHAERRVLQITTKHPIILEVNLEIHYGASKRPGHLSLLHRGGGPVSMHLRWCLLGKQRWKGGPRGMRQFEKSGTLWQSKE